MITFKTIHKDIHSKARVGELHTPHGIVGTPAFVPVGTQATVKSLTPEDLQAIGVQILFGNTYHLHLRPGEDIVEHFGGLGKFMHWPGVTMTDSGGFQVFSLAKKACSSEQGKLVKVTENGVIFTSHLDGSKHEFTPERSIAIQKKIGADIILVFDQCTTYPITHESAKADMERTHRWALRSVAAFQKKGIFDQALYGIVQGSIFADLRKTSAKFIASQKFDGIAIGGVSVGETKQEMHEAVDNSIPFLPENKVRHLLGIGDIDDIFEIVERGIDTFDCVTPTRLGRMGHIFVHPPEGNMANRFRYDITKAQFAQSSDPLSVGCSCYVCENFTRGYLHHLFRAKELLAYRLATYHNLSIIIEVTKQIRNALLEGTFSTLKKSWLK